MGTDYHGVSQFGRANMINRYPAWGQMTPDQKFEFLNEWATNLTNSDRYRQNELQSLQEQILHLQSEVSNLSRALGQLGG
jgi:hypothetical protein